MDDPEDARGVRGRARGRQGGHDRERRVLSEIELTEQQKIQQGILPARSIRELVDAQRQNFAGAGFDLGTIRFLCEAETINRVALDSAVRRLTGHIEKASHKATLAFEAEAARRRELQERIDVWRQNG